ncbi:hypothetical protein CEUSTIGMA_g12050.t1 [Chlamydomonas eustigma]|uniref:5-methyltetrahydropteroyltriglutamate--homocysteine S-methyltransferase n=1 Tax=Chlamydomonas eustigma TaxID=1157962 RepID=A0A250XNV7_9CHLO|nr:hypothetical protein CEUSTIGMA_g12050.t1 [Chlamydomonas eustigma]|eukprot:GAX84629.1 hypothetical protein CEUSTIGMA_g12050.t1 [Chlamydomonas eustigma]
MLSTSTIGFPRIGSQRQMKVSLERFWKGGASEKELLDTLNEVENEAWSVQKGIQSVGLDSTLYDHVLDTAFWLGAVPNRFQHLSGLQQYFAMARGAEGKPALDMSKLFDTNYHFLVPELEPDTFPLKPNFELVLSKVQRGQALLGKDAAVPILVGPITFVSLARGSVPAAKSLPQILPVYEKLVQEMGKLGVKSIQIHEPILVTSAGASLKDSFLAAYNTLAAAASRCGIAELNLVTYYDDLEEEVYRWAVQLPVSAVQLDFLGVVGATVSNRNLEWVEKYGWPEGKKLIAGVVDGRSVWADLEGHACWILHRLLTKVSSTSLVVSSSTPLQHLPFSLDNEPAGRVPAALQPRLAFAVQKVAEIVAAATAASGNKQQAAGRHLPLDADYGYGEKDFSRPEPYSARRNKQIAMPPFPTTTIGSFPQTKEVRAARAAFRAGKTTQAEYERAIASHIGMAVGVQEALGLDVLVHGEAERTDMVEFFGQMLEGFHFTFNGWVQSYGSRYVRPPIIVSDVKFLQPMTTIEYKIAQSLTSRPMKGMLTGPVTVLNWSFPRKDISRKAQALQLAGALRQEVAALEATGCRVVQVDEPALREGLPLKTTRHAAYLRWAVDAFRLTTSVASPATQVVTHLCYSDFQDIMQAINEMDADVLTIENSRSGNEMVTALAESGYTRDVGPGVYDVHSPQVPPVDFVKAKIKSFMDSGILAGQPDRLWVNPDCGLKTRAWPETIAALRNMVQAAEECRKELVPGWKPQQPAGISGGQKCCC